MGVLIWASTACSPCASLLYICDGHCSTAHRISFINDVAQGGQNIGAVRARHQAAPLRVHALRLNDLKQDWLTAEDDRFGCWVIAACSTGGRLLQQAVDKMKAACPVT